MSGFIASNTYNICAENEISIILSHFNSEFIFDVIKDNINKRFQYCQLNMTNIPASFEQHFKQLQATFTGDIDSIEDTRIDTYKQIINILCTESGLQFNEYAVTDYYSAAFYLYNFLVSNFVNNLVSFFANYIIKEKNNLYESLGLVNFKKNKDSSTLYAKRIYKNTKLAIINANLDYVIDNICVFDIPFELLLNTIYQDKNAVKYLSSMVTPLYDFFKTTYVSLVQSGLRCILLTNIRMEIQRLSVSEEISITNGGV